MKAKKSSTRDRRTSKPRINDLPVSDARAKGTKGGGLSMVANTLSNIGKANETMASKG